MLQYSAMLFSKLFALSTQGLWLASSTHWTTSIDGWEPRARTSHKARSQTSICRSWCTSQCQTCHTEQDEQDFLTHRLIHRCLPGDYVYTWQTLDNCVLTQWSTRRNVYAQLWRAGCLTSPSSLCQWERHQYGTKADADSQIAMCKAMQHQAVEAVNLQGKSINCQIITPQITKWCKFWGPIDASVRTHRGPLSF